LKASYITKLKTSAEPGLNETNILTLIQALREMEEYDSALEWVNEAIKRGIGAHRFHKTRAELLGEVRSWDEAVACYRQAISLAPNEAALYEGLGRALCVQMGDYNAAAELFIRAIELNPDSQDHYDGYAQAIINQGLFRDVFPLAENRLPACGSGLKLLSGLAVMLISHGRYEEAQECAEIMQIREPDSRMSLLALAQIAEDKDRDFNASRCYFTEAFERNPHDPLCFRFYLNHLAKAGKWDVARAIFRGAYHGMGFTSLRYEGEIPYWDGAKLQGKTILLDSSRIMGGYGDAIQFIRFARNLKSEGSKVGVISRKATAPLLATAPGVDFVVERYGERPHVDYVCDLSLLWLMLDVGMDDLGAAVPYLASTPEKCQIWRKKISGTVDFKVGLVWRGSSYYKSNQYLARSVPVEDITILKTVPGVQFYVLQKDQKDDASEALSPTGKDPKFKYLSDDLIDFTDTAGAILSLDLVITIDTSVAHLAGALGKPTYTLLPYSSDWRWLQNRDDSPWYPDMRLFRQARAGDWKAVVQSAADSLRHHIDQPAKPRANAL
jgi:Tfp pilus assembly protein PilF